MQFGNQSMDRRSKTISFIERKVLELESGVSIVELLIA